MDGTGVSNTCHLARLPYELRQRITKYALEKKGSIGIQTPTWDHGSSFGEPMFAVSRTLRDEALEAFYQTNTFVWNVNRGHSPGAQPDSDPSTYPLEPKGVQHALTPSLPWYYPHLLKNLRYLIINVCIPPNRDAMAWSMTFPLQLRSLVEALNGGSKLKRLRICASTGHWDSAFPPDEAQVDCLRLLFQWRAAGNFGMLALPSGNELSAAIRSLGRK